MAETVEAEQCFGSKRPRVELDVCAYRTPVIVLGRDPPAAHETDRLHFDDHGVSPFLLCPYIC